MISMNKNKYPQNQEEKKDMKKPYAADKCPKKFIFTTIGPSYKSERSTIIVPVAYQKTNPCAMAPTLEPHSNPKLSWQQKKQTFSVCAEDPNSCLNATAATNCSPSELIKPNHQYIPIQYHKIIKFELYNRSIVQMVNYNMGQYYAWTNFTKLIKSFYRRHFFSPSYKFTYIPPKVHTNHTFVPFQSWKANKLRDQSQTKYTLLGLCFLSFILSKFAYQVVNDDDIGYYYHTQNPIISQSVVWICADLAEFANPFLEIMPKNKYDIVMIYPKFFELLLGSEKRIKSQDEKALQLRKEIAEYDARAKSQQNVM